MTACIWSDRWLVNVHAMMSTYNTKGTRNKDEAARKSALNAQGAAPGECGCIAALGLSQYIYAGRRLRNAADLQDNMGSEIDSCWKLAGSKHGLVFVQQRGADNHFFTQCYSYGS
jgi:hypothetical protein